jgi:hypothetical protein
MNRHNIFIQNNEKLWQFKSVVNLKTCLLTLNPLKFPIFYNDITIHKQSLITKTHLLKLCLIEKLYYSLPVNVFITRFNHLSISR